MRQVTDDQKRTISSLAMEAKRLESDIDKQL